MAAGYLLSRKHEVTLFEKAPRLGGHTHTHTIETSCGPQAIDTGFIVHNDRTYPNLVQLFRQLGVSRQLSDMSFGVSCRQTGFEYSSRGLRGFFSHPGAWHQWKHYRFFAEILRFNHEARQLLSDPANGSLTLQQYLDAQKFSEDFQRLYLYPMAAAVWSTSLEEMEAFPAFTLIRFFDNHGFLGLTTQAQWYVLRGGSSSYIPALTAPYRDRVRLGAQLAAVRRVPTGVELCFDDRPPENFDEVVFACHAPQALQLLQDATPAERQILGQFRTTRNETVLHTDSRLLPRASQARASWNYHLGARRKSATLTYHMNRLQQLPTREDYCVTLNDTESIESRNILREMTYYHPLYDLEALRAQSRWGEISGPNRTHFCGAYWFYGFHEDGLNSAIRVSKALGVDWQGGA
jgi:predicted NAD/FAD-binding protein